jgi:hypothetical protein
MAELPTSFMEARRRVEPTDLDKDNAQEAHRLVRTCLEADPTLISYGVETALIGSYRRQVSIRRVKDVDTLCKLPDLPRDVDSAALLSDIRGLLNNKFEEARVTPQDRSIKVKFPDFDMHVDVVPARSGTSYLEIPDGDGGWMETNPEKFTELTITMNQRYDGRYVPLVKLVRQARRASLAKRPGGFLFEVLAYHACNVGLSASCDAELFTGAVRSISNQLAAIATGGTVSDPTRPGCTITVRVTDDQLATAVEKFEKVADRAEAALAEADRCAAALEFRKILGKNPDDDWIFEIPAECNDDGSLRKTSVTIPGERLIPAGDSRFA